MSAYCLYALPSDDKSVGATVTASAEDSGYVAANLAQGYDANQNRPAKLTTTTGNWVFDLLSAQTIDYVALIYHNLDAGLSVSIQGNASDSWGAPSLSQAITIPAHHADGWPVNPFQALTGSRTFRYWRLLISGTNSLTIDLRRCLLLSTLRTFPADLRMGVRFSEMHRDLVEMTELGIDTVYDLGGKERMIDGDVPTRGTAATDFLTLRRTVNGRVQPWLFVPDSRVNDAWFVRFVDPTDSFSYQANSYYPHGFTVKEVARGVPWP